MNIVKKRVHVRKAKHRSIRKKISGTSAKPRLCVKRSLKNIFAQVIDDDSGKSLLQISTVGLEQKGTKTDVSKKLGSVIAEKAKDLGIETVVFDRGGYKFHGRIKAMLDSAREAGLKC